MNQIIYCDMDGVLVNFMEGAEAVLGHIFDSSMNDAMNQKDRDVIVKLGISFWKNLPPMPDMPTLWKILSKYNAHILSARANWDASGINYSPQGKMLWIKKHLHISLTRVHIVDRSQKKDYAVSEYGKNILIDDYKKNIIEFERAGGIGIHHTTAQNTLRQLQLLGYH